MRRVIYIPHDNETPPFNFNSVTIPLDATLRWENAKSYGEKMRQLGFSIIWDINLFSHLRSPISDEAQFRTFALTLEHFNNTLFPHFEKETSGVILYKGPFIPDFPWTLEEEEGFCKLFPAPNHFKKKMFSRDLFINYLRDLSSYLDEKIMLFLLLETVDIHLLSEICFDIFHIATKEPYEVLPLYGWNHGNSSLGYFSQSYHPAVNHRELSSAFMLPPTSLLNNPIEIPQQCRIIPEAHLTQEWHGVETIYYYPEFLTQQGKRKLAGFEAAGGLICPLESKSV